MTTGTVLLCFGLLSSTAPAQDGRPQPLPANGPQPAQAQPQPQPQPANRGATRNGRRPAGEEKVKFSFNEVTIDKTISFIVETTGKVIIPIDLSTILKAKKITLIIDKFIDRSEALDLLFQAFRLNEIGVIEKEDRIIIAALTEILQFDPPVVGPDVDIMGDTNRGTVITKHYQLRNTDAETVSGSIEETLPDWATMTVDTGSNQIILQGDIGLCQRVQEMINQLDQVWKTPKTMTFRLKYADANELAQQILDLFEETQSRSGGRSTRTQQPSARRGQSADQRRALQRARAGTGSDGIGGEPLELRITVDIQQNSVTVSGEPTVVDQVAQLIVNDWDLPRPEGTAKVYQLTYTDPIKVRDMLQELLGQESGGRLGGGRGPGGGGQRADIQDIVSGIYRIEAYPDSNTLLVVCKTEESFNFLDSIIAELDRPIIPRLPLVVPLKHADAEAVCDQVNALLAPAGARVDIQRRQTGLEGFDIGGPAQGDAGGTGAAREGEDGGAITFPWQQTRQTEDESAPSALIGKVRVVPIHRQNAVMILAPAEYRDAVRDFIVNELDSPGRQVMISAIIAEIELTDELALGLRFSNSDSILSGAPVDNRLGGTFGFIGQEDPLFENFLDMSVLDVNFSINAAIQALSQKTNVRVLQEPRIFTADNQEASFFQGQDVPILSGTQTTDVGTVNEQIDYQQVGVGLNVRPRITVTGDVDLEINLEISSISGAELFGSPIFDRRETTTQVIVKNGQTIVISGIMKEIESKITRGLPFISDIPLLGELFKSRENTTSRTELIAFITPVIVVDPSENDTNFNREELEHLDDLMLPLKEQTRRIRKNKEDLRSRLLYQQYERSQQPPVDVDDLNDG
ncbi:MAG: secretin N-terminal domain-containing protein [Phycisphaerales bacterium]